MRYKYRLLTQSQLGELFGVSSHKIGDWLITCGLRHEKTKKPTTEAHRGGYCDTAPSGPTGYCWAWVAEKTVRRLDEAGHKIVPETPTHLVEPPALAGPFEVRSDDPTSVINAEGRFVFRAAAPSHAAVLVRLLNAAHRRETLGRLL